MLISDPRRTAQWIWTGEPLAAPPNGFTWFRTVIDLDEAPSDATVEFAADSTARLWINGTILRRKVTRFHEPAVRSEVVSAAAHLRPGRNTVVVLHHNWGEITTFQRTANLRAGLYVSGTWVASTASWRWRRADEFAADVDQFRGVGEGTPRIRYPVIWDARTGEDPSRYHDPGFDDSAWSAAVPVKNGPWPDHPVPVETPAQRESFQPALTVLAAGEVEATGDVRSSMASAAFKPDVASGVAAADLVRGNPYRIVGTAGETRFVTIDLQRPVHGYPFIDLECDADVQVAIGYGELAVSPYDGAELVRTNGWIDVDGVVGPGYADSIHPALGRSEYEIPDERTARWLTVHVRFDSTGEVALHRLGMVKSQYPIERRGSFECGDERVDQIVRLALIHAELTMSDSYVDTPGREDGQWIEDARPRAVLASRWFGDSRLRRLTIRTLAEGQTAEGAFHPFYPSNFLYGEAQWDWSLQWIGMVVDEYRWTGDVLFAEAHFAGIRRLLARLAADVDDEGVWRSSHVFADIRTSVPTPEGGSSGVVTPWLIDRLIDSAELAGALGEPAIAAEWTALASRMSAAFRSRHLTNRNPFGVPLVADSIDRNDLPSGFSQAAQIVPLSDGLLTVDEAAAIIEVAFPAPEASPPAGIARWNNPTWSYRLLRSLTVRGYPERALAHVLERFGPFLPRHPDHDADPALQGPYGGPLPEYWLSRRDLGLEPGELNPHQPQDPTGSHGWAAMPLLWLHEYLLGVTIVAVGGSRLRVRPLSAGLPFITGVTVTPRGPVYVHFEPQEQRLIVELPPGVTAELHLPPEFEGVTVREVGSRIPTSTPGMTIELDAGRWEFVAMGPAWPSRSPGS